MLYTYILGRKMHSTFCFLLTTTTLLRLSAGFLLPSSPSSPSSPSFTTAIRTWKTTKLDAKRNTGNTDTDERKQNTKNKNRISVQQIVEEFNAQSTNQNLNDGKKKKSRRSRRRVGAPKQKYLYAAQRRELELKGINIKKKSEEGDVVDGDGDEDGDEDDDGTPSSNQIRLQIGEDSPISIARKMGMNPSSQACDPSFAWMRGDDDTDSDNTLVPIDKPEILGEIRVGSSENESQSSMYAYIIQKPAGWAILEGNKKKGKKQRQEPKTEEPQNMKKKKGNKKSPPDENNDNDDGSVSKKKNMKQLQYYNQETDRAEPWEIDLDAFDLSSIMTGEELEEFEQEGGIDTFNYEGSNTTLKKYVEDVPVEQKVSEKISKVSNDVPAYFLPESRPSVVAWLKELKATEGTPIRGGKNWKAITGAVDIDDSGLVILCPKENVDNIFVDSAQYFAVVGNGKFLAPKGKKNRQSGSKKQRTVDDAEFEIYAKLKKGRGSNIVTTSKLTIPDGASTCKDAVQLCQNKYLDGVLGDPEANPLERRANRRLVHCSSLTVSSLSYDDLVECESQIPDDICVLSERRNHHEFHKGSFLGRGILSKNKHTTAYREINGAADGWPGWIVDRYDKWLFVQHDEMYPRGPLPSLHDGYTSGVYYFASDPDRSITGSVKGIKPILLEGQPAPEMIEIEENGIKYHVNFDDLSTGIFLDQRLQRAWLARHCTEKTRVLNCFAHCGAFSVAAATAGAETVSLDLDKKWLDRIEPQVMANGIDDLNRHDSIYGDCFDWLTRLSNRGEKFDIVILDPPSTSVGGKKKKRWSAKNDYDDLVKLATPLVKEGGFLWTTTNSNQISSIKFSRMCKKGMTEAGFPNAKLDRIATMPLDFPSIGPQQVKNLVWKL